MLLELSKIRGFDILAEDGSIGTASDFFFDDRGWVIRYLVVDTGWLFGREVLISPEAIQAVDKENDALRLSLTKNAIKSSPGIDTNLPVSMQEERKLRNHFGWSEYWGAYPGGVGAAPLIAPIQPREAFEPKAFEGETALREEHGTEDSHLRSANEVDGYHIAATDDDVGHIKDMIIDIGGWTIRYIVIDTRNWLPGRKVLMAPGWAKWIDWSNRKLQVSVDRGTIENSPELDPDSPLGRNYEAALHDHYGQQHYWA